MRITGGEWRGRQVLMPKGEKTRPTQDRVREALFSMLMYVIGEARVLDLYAGSGSFGLEAMSRGAREVMFVEGDGVVYETLVRNGEAFGLDMGMCGARALVEKWLAGQGALPVGVKRVFDVVFADAPYGLAEELGVEGLARMVREAGVLRMGGFLVLEVSERVKGVELAGYELLRDRLYGKSRIVLYKWLDGEGGAV